VTRRFPDFEPYRWPGMAPEEPTTLHTSPRLSEGERRRLAYFMLASNGQAPEAPFERQRLRATPFQQSPGAAFHDAVQRVNAYLAKREEIEFMNAIPKPTPKGPKIYQGEFLNDRELEAEKDRPEEEGEVEAKEDAAEGFQDYDDREPDASGDPDFGDEPGQDFSDKPIGEHSRTNPNGPPAEKKPAKSKGRR
jgi:hypothetical protein